MKNFKKFLLQVLLAVFIGASLANADEVRDPIVSLASPRAQDESKLEQDKSSVRIKPLANDASDNDDDDFPTDDEPTDNNFSALYGSRKDVVTNMLLQSVSLIGISYKWGGNTPTSGMDCSGFIRYVYQKSLGISLPRTAAEQARVGKRIAIDELQPGDLMFFNSRRGSNTHVGMYLGNNKFIQSPHTGDVIRISEFNDSWRKRFNGAKRIINSEADSNGTSDVETYQNIHDQPLPVTYRAKYSKRSRHARHHGKVTKSAATKSAKSTNRSRKSSVVAKAKPGAKKPLKKTKN